MRKFKYALLLASMLMAMTGAAVDARDPKLSAERPSAATPAGPLVTGGKIAAAALSCPINQPIYNQYCDTGWVYLGVYGGEAFWYYGRYWYASNFSTYCGYQAWYWTPSLGMKYWGWFTNNLVCGF